MSGLSILILGLIQGIAEFLPISSSGHLGIFQYFFGLKDYLVLDIFLNTASFLSVLIFFRHRFRDFINYIPLLFISLAPLVIFVLLTNDHVDIIFSNPIIISFGFFITSLVLFSTKFIKTKNQIITPITALIIGLSQILAVLPGVSRSGMTIFTSLLLGLDPVIAFRYSFYLYVPSSLGALILSLSKGLNISYFVNYWPAFLICFIIGLLCLKLLQKIVINHHLWYFSFYTFIIFILNLVVLKL